MSTIKVDTYLTRGGASEIAIDKLKGASSAASMTVVGEGGTTTTNLQQGLAKLWCEFDQVNSNVISDSFNLSSVTDGGTGKRSLNFTNNMASSNYSTIGTSHKTGHYYGVSSGPHTGDGLSTSLYAIRTINPNASVALADMSEISDSAFGDLA